MIAEQPVSTPGQFKVDTSVERLDENLWAARVAEGWDIVGNTNGGYLLATLARALTEATGRPHPLTLTGHFLAPARPGSVEIRTKILKVGKGITTGSATMFAGDRPLVAALGSFGHHDSSGEVLYANGAPPELPPTAESVRVQRRDDQDASEPLPPPFVNKVDLRLHSEDAGFGIGRPSGRPRFRAWFRLPEGETIDSSALILAADSLPPTSFNSGLPLAWTPTVELTVHERAIPEPGWLRLDYETRFISNGRLEVDGLVWDSTDRLVAQSRQLALVPKPSGAEV